MKIQLHLSKKYFTSDSGIHQIQAAAVGVGFIRPSDLTFEIGGARFIPPSRKSPSCSVADSPPVSLDDKPSVRPRQREAADPAHSSIRNIFFGGAFINTGLVEGGAVSPPPRRSIGVLNGSLFSVRPILRDRS